MSDIQISVRGQRRIVPAVPAGGFQIVTSGRWLKIASILDEEYTIAPLSDPEQVMRSFSQHGGKADLFTFSQRIPDVRPRFNFPISWDNAAIIDIESYETWLASLGQVTRRNIRLAEKRGVTVARASFNDEFVQGIHDIYNETPVRHGRRFWHYGKSIDQVRQDNGTYSDRSAFIGAYFAGKLIGFIKIVYVGEVASIMQILSMSAHQDKRPTNALIAKAVALCAEQGVRYLKYCKYVYHRNHEDQLTDFKRRNGFQAVVFPRYFIPLTPRGRVALALRLQRGWTDWLPGSVIGALLGTRSKYHSLVQRYSSLFSRA